jgi:ABC-type Na+ efflux pump permease subunit
MNLAGRNSKVRLLTRFNVWPVVQRELREASRRPVNHRLRLLSAGVGTLLLWVIVAILRVQRAPEAQLGGWLLCGLHTFLLGLILLVVPGLTADCIAREKREGTLGLLFLTPLSAEGIVAGKALAHALRAFTLWLAVLPLLTIPFLAGGITWFDACSALSLEFSATVLCLAAGLLASSLVKERNTAFLLAFALGAIFLVYYGQLFRILLFGGWKGFAFLKHPDWWSLEGLSLFFGLDVQGFAGWHFFAKSFATAAVRLGEIWMWLCLASPPATLLILYGVVRFASWRIDRSWQDKVPSLRRESLLRRYCTPLFRRRFQRKMQRTLDWNPIAWLQQYSWKARTSKWGLCLVFLLIELPFHNWTAREEAQLPLLLLLGGIYIFVGVSSFLEEKRSGALELLLITPFSVNKLIFGRSWGLWKQFLPAALVLLGAHECWIWGDLSGFDFYYEAVQKPFMLACGYLTLPVFATYFALRVKNLIVAAVLTIVALSAPAILAAEISQVFINSLWLVWGFTLATVFLSYGAFALLACFLLRHSLSRRIYSF